MLSFTLPTLPWNTPSATLLRWLRQPGEQITLGDPLLIVLTDRAEVLLPAPAAGTLALLHAAEGQALAAGAVLAEIEMQFTAEAQRRGELSEGFAKEEATPAVVPRRAAPVTPLARNLARAHGIDPAPVPGSGPGGRVLRRDIQALIEKPGAQSPGSRSQSVALSTQHSALSTQHSSLTVMQADMSAVLGCCARERGEFTRRGLELTPAVCVALACLAALPQHPLLNACWSTDGILLRRRLHLGIAQAGAEAVVRDAGDLNLRGLARALAVPGTTPSVAATFTLALQTEGAAWFSAPGVRPGQAATLALGVARREVLVVADGLAVRPVALLTLAYDARVLDQPQADAFLAEVRRRVDAFDGLGEIEILREGGPSRALPFGLQSIE